MALGNHYASRIRHHFPPRTDSCIGANMELLETRVYRSEMDCSLSPPSSFQATRAREGDDDLSNRLKAH